MTKKKKTTEPAAVKPTESKAAAAVKPTEERVTFEQHAESAGTPAWLLAATVAKHGWPRQFAMTRKQFDQAVQAARTERIQ